MNKEEVPMFVVGLVLLACVVVPWLVGAWTMVGWLIKP